jgi:LPS export ABC transporter protein LptC
MKPIAVLLAGAAIFLSSCDNSLEIVPGTDVKSLPLLTVHNFETVQTDSGKVQMVLRSPLMERRTIEEETYNEFPNGVEVIFYDGKKEQVASVTSQYAKYSESKKLWELRYEVKARNEQNELLETELLYWDEEKELVHTDKFVRITGEERIISGTGFESDTRFSRWEIRNGNAIIYIKDE